jgi:hypothetical protein
MKTVGRSAVADRVDRARRLRSVEWLPTPLPPCYQRAGGGSRRQAERDHPFERAVTVIRGHTGEGLKPARPYGGRNRHYADDRGQHRLDPEPSSNMSGQCSPQSKTDKQDLGPECSHSLYALASGRVHPSGGSRRCWLAAGGYWGRAGMSPDWARRVSAGGDVDDRLRSRDLRMPDEGVSSAEAGAVGRGDPGRTWPASSTVGSALMVSNAARAWGPRKSCPSRAGRVNDAMAENSACERKGSTVSVARFR